jgi:hypothetical protein
VVRSWAPTKRADVRHHVIACAILLGLYQHRTTATLMPSDHRHLQGRQNPASRQLMPLAFGARLVGIITLVGHPA